MRFLGGAVFLFYDDAAASADGNIFAIAGFAAKDRE
jgi:hypothetical protein